ncbi:MAG: ATP-binding protein [Acidobacteriota bacterium]
MTIERLFSKPWRIALAYIVFSMLALALFAMPLWHAWRFNVGTLRVFVPEDMEALPDLFHREGPAAVAAAVRARRDPGGLEVIVFAGPGRKVLAGTLRRWPREIPDAPGTYGHVIDPGDGSRMRVVVTQVFLPGGYRLLMGRQSSGLMSLEVKFWYGMASALTIVMGLGAALAWLFARRANAARQSEERYALAMTAAGDGHADWNLLTGEHYISPRLLQICGYAPGTTFRDRAEWERRLPCHPDDRTTWDEALARHFAGRDSNFKMELRIVVEGEVRWTAAHFLSTRDAEGKPVRWTGSIGDITEAKLADLTLRTMELELRRAHRLEAIGTLAGGIAHDFNNILGAILGYGEMAMRGTRKGTRMHRDLDSIMAAGERGRSLIDRILAFSRSGVGESVPVHVEAVVREVLDQVGANLPENVTIAASLRSGHAAMLGDSTQVHQVVMNLAANAVQAMPRGGVLRVELATERVDVARRVTLGSLQPGNYIVLEISDTGTGIREEVLERMFDPFFTTKDVGVGTGLGLSLVHGIVTSVGGAIDVTTKLDQGSTFVVYMPRSGDAPATVADPSSPLPRGAGQRVLVVDDEEPLVRLATETLESLGYVPVGFTSSVDALQVFSANPGRFDAILTDERMPGLTGSAIIREVRRIDPSLPILLMSGFVGGTAANARELGASDVLKKPLLARDLATSLAHLLRP